jgi:hypothetical protein
MNYEQIETDIVTRLSTLTPACEVIKLPEVQADYNTRPINKPRITVAYKGSKFEEPHTTAQISQFEDVMIDVTLEWKKLRGTNGVYPLMEAIRKRLIGFEPTDCHRMFLKESGFTELEQNMWSYSFTFVTRGMIVETDPEENDAPLVYISVENATGEQVIQVGEEPTPTP